MSKIDDGPEEQNKIEVVALTPVQSNFPAESFKPVKGNAYIHSI